MPRISIFQKSNTLLELLLAIAILVVATVLAAQILNSASSITHQGISKMNMDACARTVFERMSIDLKAALRRNDIDYLFQKQNGNDQMAFYSQTSGFYPPGVTGLKPKSTVTLICYRIENNHLKRMSKALLWNGVTNSTPSTSDLPENGVAMVFSPISLSSQWNLLTTGTDSDYQVLNNQVFRQEFCFLTRNSTFSGLFDPLNTTAVIITLALVKNQNLPCNFDLSQFAESLPDGDDPSIADQWLSKVASLAYSYHGNIPEIRIYQRVFQLGAIP